MFFFLMSARTINFLSCSILHMRIVTLIFCLQMLVVSSEVVLIATDNSCFSVLFSAGMWSWSSWDLYRS